MVDLWWVNGGFPPTFSSSIFTLWISPFSDKANGLCSWIPVMQGRGGLALDEDLIGCVFPLFSSYIISHLFVISHVIYAVYEYLLCICVFSPLCVETTTCTLNQTYHTLTYSSIQMHIVDDMVRQVFSNIYNYIHTLYTQGPRGCSVTRFHTQPLATIFVHTLRATGPGPRSRCDISDESCIRLSLRQVQVPVDVFMTSPSSEQLVENGFAVYIYNYIFIIIHICMHTHRCKQKDVCNTQSYSYM